ncbi:hypothetical protein Bca101_077485 [Brassica carinata]
MAKKTSKSTADGTLCRVLPCCSLWVGKCQDHLQAYPFMGTSLDLCRGVIHQQTGSMLQGFISPYRVAQDGSRTAFESKYEKLY